MVSVAIVSIVILATVYYPYERAMLTFVNWVMAENRNLAFFMMVILVLPLILLLL
jgi:hypothetical protein